MKKIFLAAFSTLLFSFSTIACPEAGKIKLKAKDSGEVVGTLDTYSSTLLISEGNEIGGVSSQSSSLSKGVFPNYGHNLSWICNNYNTENVKKCSELLTGRPKEYSMPEGNQHFVISVIGTSDKSYRVFQIDYVNMDRNQPMAKGGCGLTVESSNQISKQSNEGL